MRVRDRVLREGTTLVMAIRPWELNLFTELRRKGKPDQQQPRMVRRGV